MNIGNVYLLTGEIDKALVHYKEALKFNEEFCDKREIGFCLNNIGMANCIKGDYKKAEEYLHKSISIKKEIGLVRDNILQSTTYLYLTYKHLGKDYDEKEIHNLIKEAENIEFGLNYAIYQLVEDKSYLETAYNQIQENASAMDKELAAKFLSHPIPKAIVEEWEKVK